MARGRCRGESAGCTSFFTFVSMSKYAQTNITDRDVLSRKANQKEPEREGVVQSGPRCRA